MHSPSKQMLKIEIQPPLQTQYFSDRPQLPNGQFYEPVPRNLINLRPTLT
jgi:hypothetical protein